jgi:hypothetical protein
MSQARPRCGRDIPSLAHQPARETQKVRAPGVLEKKAFLVAYYGMTKGVASR